MRGIARAVMSVCMCVGRSGGKSGLQRDARLHFGERLLILRGCQKVDDGMLVAEAVLDACQYFLGLIHFLARLCLRRRLQPLSLRRDARPLVDLLQLVPVNALLRLLISSCGTALLCGWKPAEELKRRWRFRRRCLSG